MSEISSSSLRIGVTGGSGLIGRNLIEHLRKSGYTALPLNRNTGEIAWNVATGQITFPGKLDILIHLAGRSVATRWTTKARREIWDSRVPATEKLCESLARLSATERPRLLISTSAIGIYGNRGDEVLTEASAIEPDGRSFLADVCRGWEKATSRAEQAGIRVIHPRFGVVLSGKGGALAKMLTPTKLGLGGPIGRGTQWMSWISLTDAVRLLTHLMLSSELKGPVNAVTPSPVRQHEFMRTLGKVVHRPTVFPLPSMIVKAVFGQMGREVLLSSQRVIPTRIPPEFEFLHPTLEQAIRAELAPSSIP